MDIPATGLGEKYSLELKWMRARDQSAIYHLHHGLTFALKIGASP
jgi:hypothetical protein